MVVNSFKSENKFFDANVESWIEEGRFGQFVVLNGTSLIGFYKTAEEAFRVVEKSGEQLFSAIVQKQDATNMVFLSESS